MDSVKKLQKVISKLRNVLEKNKKISDFKKTKICRKNKK